MRFFSNPEGHASFVDRFFTTIPVSCRAKQIWPLDNTDNAVVSVNIYFRWLADQETPTNRITICYQRADLYSIFDFYRDVFWNVVLFIMFINPRVRSPPGWKAALLSSLQLGNTKLNCCSFLATRFQLHWNRTLNTKFKKEKGSCVSLLLNNVNLLYTESSYFFVFCLFFAGASLL